MPLALSILKGQGGDIDVDFGGGEEGTTFILKFSSDITYAGRPGIVSKWQNCHNNNFFCHGTVICIARMVFRRLRNLLKPRLNCEESDKRHERHWGAMKALRRLIQR